MKPRIATVHATALVPGVSRNGRLYTAAHVTEAAAQITAQIASGGLPILMRTHHKAGDDSTRIVGRWTGAEVVGESLRVSGDVADTSAGRDTLALTSGKEPYLRNVSIFGSWTGPTRKVMVDGKPAETAEGIHIDAIDFTGAPGVLGAKVESVNVSETSEPYAGAIAESVELEVDVIDEGDAPEGGLAEGYVHTSADTGKTSVSVTTRGKDTKAAHDKAHAATSAALGAVGDDEVDDNTRCPNCGAAIESKEADMAEARTPEERAAAASAADTAAAIAADKGRAAETAAPVAETASVEADKANEALAATIAKAVAEALATKPVAETATPVAPVADAATLAESAKAMVDEAVKAQTDAIRAEMVATYGPRRKGLVEHSAVPADKPLHTLTEEEWLTKQVEAADYFAPTSAAPAL